MSRPSREQTRQGNDTPPSMSRGFRILSKGSRNLDSPRATRPGSRQGTNCRPCRVCWLRQFIFVRCSRELGNIFAIPENGCQSESSAPLECGTLLPLWARPRNREQAPALQRVAAHRPRRPPQEGPKTHQISLITTLRRRFRTPSRAPRSGCRAAGRAGGGGYCRRSRPPLHNRPC